MLLKDMIKLHDISETFILVSLNGDRLSIYPNYFVNFSFPSIWAFIVYRF